MGRSWRGENERGPVLVPPAASRPCAPSSSLVLRGFSSKSPCFRVLTEVPPARPCQLPTRRTRDPAPRRARPHGVRDLWRVCQPAPQTSVSPEVPLGTLGPHALLLILPSQEARPRGCSSAGETARFLPSLTVRGTNATPAPWSMQLRRVFCSPLSEGCSEGPGTVCRRVASAGRGSACRRGPRGPGAGPLRGPRWGSGRTPS